MKIYIAGHTGMVGSAIENFLQSNPNNVIIKKTHKELDLTNQNSVDQFMMKERPDQIYLSAAKVGGIKANNIYPADFIYQNLMIEANIIHSAYKNNVNKLLFLGSSCIYPVNINQPMNEEALLSGKLEPTNEPYAVAKIAGIKLCESYNRQYNLDYRSVMPTNLYGPGDNYHRENSHVIPSLIRRFHEAKKNSKSTVILWGSGKPLREFLYVDDMAAACIHVMNLSKRDYHNHTKPMNSHINVGSGEELSIKKLAQMIAKVVNFNGIIKFDPSMPDGAQRKLMDSSRLSSLGWKPIIGLENGLNLAYADFLDKIT
jgi:GDP-L-fucose synthase